MIDCMPLLLIADTCRPGRTPFCVRHQPSSQALASGKPTVIDLGARTCIPCKKMAPILESLASEYRGRANCPVHRRHEDQAAAQKFRIQMIPTQIFFNAQGKEVKRHIGFMDKADIVKELKAAGLK